MTQKSFTLTLTRWHHVAGRIAALAKSKLAEAEETLGHTKTENTLTEKQVKALEGRGSQALELLHGGLAAMEVVGQIRKALAQANGKHGVAAMLAEAEEKRARARALERFAEIDLLSTTHVSEVNDVLNSRGGDNSIMYRGVRVAVVDIDSLDFVRQTRRDLEAQASAISDQVAELNRQTMTLDLDDALAKEVGL